MSAPVEPDDQIERDRIAAELDRTLFVEAGAGSGKTRALVNRVTALVDSGVAMENIAAITFTEKAAAELRSRIRERLAERVGDPLSEAALRQLDAAAVGTLHAFAQRLLTEHPVEAGLPPDVIVLDELRSQIDFESRWQLFVDRLLDDTSMSLPLLSLEARGVRLSDIRSLARVFDENWDRLQHSNLVPSASGDATDARSQRPACSDRPSDGDAGAAASSGRWTGPAVGEVLNAVESIEAISRHCSAYDDKLLARMNAICDHHQQIRTACTDGDPIEQLEAVLAVRGDCKGANLGTEANWGGKEVVEQARQSIRTLKEICDETVQTTSRAALQRVAERLARFSLDAAEQRRRAGHLEFHDLLVQACALLRHQEHGAEVRATLRDRYQRLLLDEFQDTDPLQIDLAMLLACEPHADPVEAGSEAARVQAGRLFFVGDPKQSIYRFRRADIAAFLRVRSLVQADPHGEVASLTTNFRSTEPIISWINEVFSKLIVACDDSQADYEPLKPWRAAAPVGAGVTVLGSEPLDAPSGGLKAEELREMEAAAVADAITRCLRERWAVQDGDSSSGWRPARLSDIAVLIPTRTSLGALEDALQAANVAHRAESSSLVYGTREVRDAVMALQAIADPTDELALVATLRSPLYGCGDDDLAHWKLGCGGRISLIARQPDDAPEDHPVAESLAHLRSLMSAARWHDPPKLLDWLLRERGAFETAVVSHRPRDVWRRLRFVVDQARAWADAGGAGLRDYVQWARLQADESARVTETILPESDDDSVRILTVHASKGLEFPVVVLSGMTADLSRTPSGPTARFAAGGAPVIRLRAGVQTESYEQWRKTESEMDIDERLRLMYVACTRARDHLIVSLLRAADSNNRSMASVLAGAGAAVVAGVAGSSDHADSRLSASSSTPRTAHARRGAEGSEADGPPEAPPAPLCDSDARVSRGYEPVAMAPRDEWQAELRHCLQAASVPAAVGPSRLFALAQQSAGTSDEHRSFEPAVEAPASDETSPSRRRTPDETTAAISDPGLSKDETEDERPPSRKGRYGTAVGSAVHAVLQDVDLARGDNLEPLARRYAAAEGVSRRLGDVTALARAALATRVAREAAAAQQCWRELFVAAPFGQTLLEGYIDLAYRDADGHLVAVDWKTDYIEGDDDLSEKLARYRLQGAAYAAALQAVTNETVNRMVFVFLNRDPQLTVEAPINDLSAAIAEAEALASAAV